MERRTFSGGVVSTQLTANIFVATSVINVTDGSTFPLGSDVGKPFVIVIDRSTADEEKVLISTRAGNQFIVAQRGYDGTTAQNHSAGAVVDHVLDATVMRDMNDTVYDTQVLNWMGI